MLIRAKCSACGYETVYELDLCDHGFFAIPQGFCPNDMALLDQDVTYTTGSTVTPEDENDVT